MDVCFLPLLIIISFSNLESYVIAKREQSYTLRQHKQWLELGFGANIGMNPNSNAYCVTLSKLPNLSVPQLGMKQDLPFRVITRIH